MKRFAIAALLAAVASGTSWLWLRGYHIEPKHGTRLAAVGGVDIYYHREGIERRGQFGLEYECVEFVNRWLAVHGHRNLSRTGHALSYFNEAKAKGLVPYNNGGSVKPQHGDVIVFESSQHDFGHVGIVVEVNSDSVLVAQQNATMRAAFLAKPMPLERFALADSEGKWTVAPRRPLACIGWARRK